MRANRRFLFWGVFLLALGGVLVASDLRAVDTALLTDALQLWPLAVVAIGLGLVLRTTRLSLPALLVASAVPGLVLGSAFAVAPRFPGDCGVRDSSAPGTTSQGAFDGAAAVTVRTGCGSLDVRTAAGTGWRFDAASSAATTPAVTSTSRSLEIAAGGTREAHPFERGRDAWDLTLPTADLSELSLNVNLGSGAADLAGARIQRLSVTADLAHVDVDASSASVAEVALAVNLGSLSFRLPGASDVTGTLRVSGGDLRVCAPSGLGLRVTSTGTAEHITVNGLEHQGSDWESPDYTTATHRTDLSVQATFGSVEINPIGGC